MGVGELPSEIGHFGFEGEDAADAGQGHAFAGHGRDPLHLTDVVPAVAALPAVGSGRSHDFFEVDAPQEGGLDAEHACDLADGVERGVLVVER